MPGESGRQTTPSVSTRTKAQSLQGKGLPRHFAAFIHRLPYALLLLVLWALTLAAQQVGQNASPEANGTTIIKASTQLVVETVGVKDKKGNPIQGLTAKDFTVTENGAPQVISFCEYQELPGANTPAPAAPSVPEDSQSLLPAGQNPNFHRTAGKLSLQRPPPAGALLRHDGHAAGGPIARAGRGEEIHPNADDGGGPRRHPAVFRRVRGCACRISPMTTTGC